VVEAKRRLHREDAMRPTLGSTNLALIACYFAPTWGRDALRALTSPFNGFEDRVQAAAASYFREVFDFGLDGLLRTSSMLAGTKLIVAAAFVAYLIEYFRALAMRREPNRETLDMVLLLAVGAMVVWSLPAFALDNAAMIRLYATQFMMLVGAAIVIMIERNLDRPAEVPSRVATLDRNAAIAPKAISL
jgi:hypothetical protein